MCVVALHVTLVALNVDVVTGQSYTSNTGHAGDNGGVYVMYACIWTCNNIVCMRACVCVYVFFFVVWVYSCVCVCTRVRV